MPERPLQIGPDRDGVTLLLEGGLVRSCSRLDAAMPAAKQPTMELEELAGETASRLHCPGGRLQPGSVNAHTHIYSGLAPLGMPPPAEAPQSFIEILERVWWPLDRALDANSLRAAARFYIAEALLAGTTSLIDHHESPNFIDGSLDVLADACQELGIRALLCYGATERNGGGEEGRRGLAECRRFIDSNRRPLIRGMVGLHASFTVSDETIREAGELCRELDVPLHVHLAEDLADVEDALARGYPDPLERLQRLGALPSGSILAHGVHLNAAQVEKAGRLGSWFVQNPRSNRGNRVGYPNALHSSTRVALGTDGYPARMEEEAEALIQEGSARGEKREVLEGRIRAGWRLLEERFGLAFGRLRGSGSEESVAGTAAGTAADVTVVEAGRVQHVIVGGRPVVQGGQLVTGDLGEIRREARTEAARLWPLMLR